MEESDCCLEMKIVKGSEREEETSTPTKEDESEPRTKLSLFFICGTLLFCHFFAQGLRENALNQYSYKEFQSIVEQDVSGNASRADAYNGSDISVSCVKSSNSTLYEGQSEAQKLTSQWNIYRTVIPGAASILTTLLFGVLSDTYGRKWFITIPLIGHFVRNALYTIGIYFRIDIYIFLAIGMTEFLFGPGEAILAAIFSTVADNTSADENRSKAIAVMILSAGVGLSTSLVSGGYIIDSAGYMYPMLISSAILLPAIILSFCLSDSSENRTVSSADNEDTFCTKIILELKGIYKFYVKESSVSGNRWKYIVCMIAFLLTQIVNGGVVNVEFLFTFNTPLCWNSIIFGWYGLAQSVTLNIVSMAFFPFIQKCLRDETINVIASISSAVSLIFEAFAINDIMMFIVPGLASVCYLAVPTLRAIMSNITPLDKQGTLFASQAIVEKVCILLGTTVGNGIYSITVDIYRGLAFFVFAVFNIIAAALIVYYIQRTKNESEKELDVKEDKDKSDVQANL